MKSNLSKVPSQRLISELIRRKEIRTVQIGLYANYELKPKYGNPEIKCNEIFIPTKKEVTKSE